MDYIHDLSTNPPDVILLSIRNELDELVSKIKEYEDVSDIYDMAENESDTNFSDSPSHLTDIVNRFSEDLSARAGISIDLNDLDFGIDNEVEIDVDQPSPSFNCMDHIYTYYSTFFMDM